MIILYEGLLDVREENLPRKDSTWVCLVLFFPRVLRDAGSNLLFFMGAASSPVTLFSNQICVVRLHSFPQPRQNTRPQLTTPNLSSWSQELGETVQFGLDWDSPCMSLLVYRKRSF